jgi:hypothetical protein
VLTPSLLLVKRRFRILGRQLTCRDVGTNLSSDEKNARWAARRRDPKASLRQYAAYATDLLKMPSIKLGWAADEQTPWMM